MIYIGVIGSRSFDNYSLLNNIINDAISKLEDSNITIVSGGAKGADKLGHKFAINNNLKYIEYKPDWDKHGKSAGFIRNKLIVDKSDMVIAFWDGSSKGTYHSMTLTKQLNKLLLLVDYNGKIEVV